MDSFGVLSKSKAEWTITNGQSRMDNHEWTIQRHRQHWARRQAKHKRPHRRPKREAKRTPPKQNGGEPMGSRMISSSCFWLDTRLVTRIVKGSSWSWSHGCWIYNYLCNQSLSPLRLWVRVPIIARCTRYNIMLLSLSVTCGRSVVFSGYFGFLHQ
jgi:hypothetical protein